MVNKLNYKSRIVGEFYKNQVLKNEYENGVKIGSHYEDSVRYYKIEVYGKILEVEDYVYDFCEDSRKVIGNSEFKFLPYSEFRTKIKELYKIDIDSIYCYWLDPQGFDVLEIIHDGYIEIGPTLACTYENYTQVMLMLNNMILHDDIKAFNWIKINAPSEIIYQVQTLGVTCNQKWLEFAFSQTDFSKSQRLDDYLFEYHADDEKLHLRTKMLDLMIEYGVEMSLLSSVLEDVEYAPHLYAGNKDELIGYLYTKIAAIGQAGYIEYRLDNAPHLMKWFEENNYFNSEDLWLFCEKVYETKEERKEKGKSSSLSPEPSYHIKDPDGYTNLRQSPSSTGEIITTILDQETIIVLDKTTNNWWKIEYQNKIGYVHKSRIEME